MTTPLIEAIARGVREAVDIDYPDRAVESARAALAAITGAGFAVVPLHPTEAMIEAGVYTECGSGALTLKDTVAASYRAMISAAQGDG